MFYLSQLQGKQVWDSWGRPVGELVDVLIGQLSQPAPDVQALLIREEEALIYIPVSQVSELFPSTVLAVPRAETSPCEPSGQDLRLVEQVLDRQIVDVDDRRVVRVNDVQFARVRNRFVVTGVDVGGRGILRRLGWESFLQGAARRLGFALPDRVIPWEDVVPVQEADVLKLRVSRARISLLHPADIAAIVNDLDRRTGQQLVATLDDATLADTLEESAPDVQVAILTQLSPERAADVLEEMGPDEAADLLADLPDETTAQLLRLMDDEDEADVRTLLAYPEDSAGGIMTTEYARVPFGMSAGEALEYLRRSEENREDEAMYYVHLMDEADALKAVVSLRDLVLAPPEAPLARWAEAEPVTVDPYASQEEMDQEDVAYLVAKYDLLSVPIVDAETHRMLGIVTVDDAIDAVLPTAWKKRLPRFF